MTTAHPTDPAPHVAWLSSVLPKGYSLTHTREGWWLKKWDSWVGPRGTGPRMGWQTVDTHRSLAVLLARLGEH